MSERPRRGHGNCGEVAAGLVVGAHLVRLCHGWPIHRTTGERFWHAWVETADGLTVVDKSNGLDVTATVEAYYALGRIEPERVQRFTPEQAVALMAATGHYGPWLPYRLTRAERRAQARQAARR